MKMLWKWKGHPFICELSEETELSTSYLRGDSQAGSGRYRKGHRGNSPEGQQVLGVREDPASPRYPFSYDLQLGRAQDLFLGSRPGFTAHSVSASLFSTIERDVSSSSLWSLGAWKACYILSYMYLKTVSSCQLIQNSSVKIIFPCILEDVPSSFQH